MKFLPFFFQKPLHNLQKSKTIFPCVIIGLINQHELYNTNQILKSMLGLKYYGVSAGLCSRSIIWANPRRFPNAVHDDVQLFKTNRTACPSSHLSTVRSHLVNITPLLLFLRLLRWLSYPRSKLFKSPAKFTSGINITFLYIYIV